VAATVTLEAQGPPTIPPDLARHAVGQVVTVCGDVGGFQCRGGQPRGLVFRTPFSGSGFEVALDRVDAALLGDPIGDRCFGQHVCATGAVEPMAKGYRIWIAGLDQLQIPEPNLEAAASAQGTFWCPRLGQGPKIVKEVKPEYTAGAMKAGVQGGVRVTAIVDVDGSVRAAVVGRSLHPEMDESAVETVRHWQFEPGMQDGKPVPMAVWIDLMFSLRK